MLSNIAAPVLSSSPHEGVIGRVAVRPGRSDALVRLDELLWVPGSLRILNADNVPLRGVYPGSVRDGLALIGQGSAAALMGTLRPGIRAVDVDLDDPLASRARDGVLAWAAERGYATLVRPSGKAGHVHVLIAGLAPDDVTLDRLCAQLRSELRVGAYDRIDPRRSRTLRTLMSPHRHGLPVGPIVGDLEAFTAAAAAATAAMAAHGSLGSPRSAGLAGWADVEDAALVPRPRSHRQLPGHVAAYMATGKVWPLRAGADTSKSTYEAIATASMVRAGWTVEEAWAAIVTAHPSAMVRARGRGGRRRWTRHVWNRAVVDNADRGAVEPIDPELVADLAAARGRLDRAAAALGPRARFAPLLVGDTILERVARTREARVPVPERDLQVDTGLDRKTVRRALRLLHGAGVIALDTTCLDRRRVGRATTSYEAVLPTRGTDEEPTPAETLVWEIPPPSRHTPGLWGHLPRSAHRAHRTLLLSPGLPVDELAPAALLTTGPSPTVQELRTAAAGLRALAVAGLAVCDVEGRWSATRTRATLDIEQAAARERAERLDVVRAERAAYRAAGGTEWDIARAAAIKGQWAREVAWWTGLPEDERSRRRAHWQDRYQRLSISEQMQVNHELARRRASVGVDEREHHHAWIMQWSDEAWAERAAIRAAAHRARPGPVQHAQRAAWDLHRDRWQLPRTSRRGPTLDAEHAALTPDSAQARDAAYLAGDQLALALSGTSDGGGQARTGTC